MQTTKCLICNGDQDTRNYEEYNICTSCSDLLEDLMSEYFLRTLKYESTKNRKSYLKYLENTKKYTTNYQRIRRHTQNQIKQLKEKIKTELQTETPRQKYLQRLHQVLTWLEKNPEFYNHYFKKYEICPNCEASLFDHYHQEKKGDWLIITCTKCNTPIKKYFSPLLLKGKLFPQKPQLKTHAEVV